MRLNLYRWFPRRLQAACWVLAGAAASGVAAQTVLAQNSMGRTLGGSYSPMASVAQELSRIVFYRAAGAGPSAGVVSVFLNGHYHTSLQANGFAVVCLQGAQLDVNSRFTSVQTQPSAALDVRRQLPIQGGQSVYVRVSSDASGRAVVESVAAAQAQTELASAKQQVHTISRVPNAVPCREEAPIRIIYDRYVISQHASPSSAALGAV
jgi:hypothetical protein